MTGWFLQSIVILQFAWICPIFNMCIVVPFMDTKFQILCNMFGMILLLVLVLITGHDSKKVVEIKLFFPQIRPIHIGGLVEHKHDVILTIVAVTIWKVLMGELNRTWWIIAVTTSPHLRYVAIMICLAISNGTLKIGRTLVIQSYVSSLLMADPQPPLRSVDPVVVVARTGMMSTNPPRRCTTCYMRLVSRCWFWFWCRCGVLYQGE